MCSEQDKTSLERLQNEAARIETGLTKSTSIENLYNECGWDSLSKRKYFKKICIMYKCSNNLVPNYISDIVPPLVGEVTNYPLRNRNNISSSGDGNDMNPALPDTSMKLGRYVYKHELFEIFSLANQNYSNFQDGGMKFQDGCQNKY